MRSLLLFSLLILTHLAKAQTKQAEVSGTIIDENDNPIQQVSITVLGKRKGIVSSDSGFFSIQIPSNSPVGLVFSHTGFNTLQRNFYLATNEKEMVTIRLTGLQKTLDNVVISDNKDRKESSLVKLDPKNAILLPGPSGGVEGLIKTLTGSNNELTSQYAVRGGNYDENLVYINDIEVFRPYLVSNAQQEGLSLINPELTKSLTFQSGAFQAAYGDKISSVLDIQYKKPSQSGGSVFISLLEQGLHAEGSLAKGRITYLTGIRNKTNRNVLSNQPTAGAYIPTSSDWQTYVTARLSEKWTLEYLDIYSSSRFTFFPESVKKTAAVFSPFFSTSLGLDIFFEGQEKDSYTTGLHALSLINTPRRKMKLKWMLSYFTDREKENYDIGSAYLFGERDVDGSSSTFGQIVNPLGAGYYQQYGRNRLDINVWNITHRGSYERGIHQWQWGVTADRTRISDKLKEWEYRDSVGYSLPYDPDILRLYRSVQSQSDLLIHKFSGFVQDNMSIPTTKGQLNLQYGARLNYNTLNQEYLISPRMSLSWIPDNNPDWSFTASAGIYNQPPFYREFRNNEGSLNTSIRAQRSWQWVMGTQYRSTLAEKPFRLSAELYYKSLSRVIPYDIDNVKIRYFGQNSARAYAAGMEIKIFSQLLKDAESWLSLGVMKTAENLNNDYYSQYLNAAGEIIGPGTTDKVVTDSQIVEVGWLRRPSDRRFTIGLFLQDYLATNKNFRVHLNMLYGSNMTYNIPNSVKYRNGLELPAYFRVDIGFSALLLDEKSKRRSHAPFGSFENIWLSLEVFNLIDRANTISFQLIRDYANNTYAIPNRLTPRLLNLKLLARF